MYKHITLADRKAIEVLLDKDCTKQEIGKAIGVHPSTVGREINKRSTPNGYFADIAQINYEQEREKCGKEVKLSNWNTRQYVINKLKVGWSPEQISGRMKYEQRLDYLCKETIYNWIYTNEWAIKEHLYQYLRLGKKKRKSWKGRKVHRSKIPNRVSIENRPKIVERRKEIGHWEGDSVIYVNKYAINTLNELKSGYVVFNKLERKTAKLTAKAMVKVLKNHSAKTVTVDNGTEFMNHEDIAQKAKVKVYFCHPYSSWERGANENINMLLRGYLPKRTDIEKLEQEELDNIAEELNNRPRKRLGYRTPAEVYQQELSNLLPKLALESRM